MCTKQGYKSPGGGEKKKDDDYDMTAVKQGWAFSLTALPCLFHRVLSVMELKANSLESVPDNSKKKGGRRGGREPKKK